MKYDKMVECSLERSKQKVEPQNGKFKKCWNQKKK